MMFHPNVPFTRGKISIRSTLDRDSDGRIWLYVPGLTHFNLTALCDQRYQGTMYLERWAHQRFADDLRGLPELQCHDFASSEL